MEWRSLNAAGSSAAEKEKTAEVVTGSLLTGAQFRILEFPASVPKTYIPAEQTHVGRDQAKRSSGNRPHRAPPSSFNIQTAAVQRIRPDRFSFDADLFILNRNPDRPIQGRVMEYEDILTVHAKAVDCGLDGKRTFMLGGIPRRYISQLALHPEPANQMQADLLSLYNENKPRKIGGVNLLERWLRNAAYSTSADPEARQFFTTHADALVTTESAHGTANATEGMTVTEKIVHVDDKLPIGFLDSASRVATSVARLLVPRHDNGQPTTFPHSTQQMEYLGTGWVLSPELVITNHHVINARDPDESDASDGDFHLQGDATRVQFDFDSQTAAGEVFEVQAVATADKSLDFAILRLKQPTQRPPLELFSAPLELPDDHYIPVNIVQHPGGAPKQIAMRNNLVSKLTDTDLSYFADTEGGSSGSPVCNDQWKVVALHKASRPAFGRVEFQGKTTAWVNIGTRIDKLIAHLQTEHSALWNEIGQ